MWFSDSFWDFVLNYGSLSHSGDLPFNLSCLFHHVSHLFIQVLILYWTRTFLYYTTIAVDRTLDGIFDGFVMSFELILDTLECVDPLLQVIE